MTDPCPCCGTPHQFDAEVASVLRDLLDAKALREAYRAGYVLGNEDDITGNPDLEEWLEEAFRDWLASRTEGTP